jgi:diguanylate cyclase
VFHTIASDGDIAPELIAMAAPIESTARNHRMATGAKQNAGAGAAALPSLQKKRPIWTVMKRCVQIAAAVDLMFFIIFYALGSPILAWINVISVSMYAAAYVCLTKRKNFVAVCLVWTEVLGHAALGTVMAGWESAFHYYLLMFIPAIFVSTKTSKAIGSVFVLWCFYIGLNATTYFLPPLEPLAPEALTVLRYFNISVVFAMFAYLSSYYYRTIAEAQRHLSMLAMTDPLTGLNNRRHILDLANYEAVKQKRTPSGLAFIIADIDYFKRINDTYGHDIGDAVLVAVSKTIRGSIREQDGAARWGGEEFLVVLPNTSVNDAILIAERIRKNVAAITVPVGQQIISTSITLGVSSYRLGDSVNNAITKADECLYKGKKAGRNRVEAALDANA